MKGFNYYQDAKNEWRWNLKDGNHEIVADSGEGYRDKTDCQKGAELFKALGPEAPERKVVEPDTSGQGPEWEYYSDRKAEWRWRFQARNNKILADSAEGYESEQNVKRSITNVKDLLRELRGSGSNGGNGGSGGYVPPTTKGSEGPGRFA
ncbi:DUF1508 domain-containing protein [Hymenobacter sp. HSC-4F20]|uniref:YegP family protein n=1 Tax=Hymenobacter sp. HSC-4F20 TaxID=2864135 RepID=UPI001C735396|nr:DUF1508 domain-containing protein [Hymenobacter sp. HSC-4F20]MBX0291695.1 DUF1508 domain-containing protein [Hymenobacter sp. HSC-4F20]